ncbi:MAG: O-methyltransferase [Chitinophagaceae bacterium]|nr:O-methyltransferase [Chitinophagaceae bacterium]
MTSILFDAALNDYAAKLSTPQLPILNELERETYRKEMQPVMLSGHLQGNILQLISHLLRPRKVLDIGTFTGYSAICLAQGLDENGVVHTIELEEERSEIAQKYFEASGFSHKIIAHYGYASEILNTLKEPWDLVFIDADKPNYAAYYDAIFDYLKIGAIIIADNVLFEGRVLLPIEEQGKNEKAMNLFNEKIKNDKRVEVTILPIRDGISIIRKIAL